MTVVQEIVGAWAFCGMFAYAITFGHLQNNPRWHSLAKEEYRKDLAFAVFAGLFGPIALFVVYFFTGFAQHGLKWR
jgi:hypothetical protein